METKLYEKEERFDAATIEALTGHYSEILRLLGEDPAREGLLKTPERVAKAMSFLTKGYDENPLEIIRSADVPRGVQTDGPSSRTIELYSLCEHHMLPFYGKAHVAYIPQRLHHRTVENRPRGRMFRPPAAGPGAGLTVQIRDCIQEALSPMGVASSSRPATCACRCAASRSSSPPQRPPPSRASSSRTTAPARSS